MERGQQRNKRVGSGGGFNRKQKTIAFVFFSSFSLTGCPNGSLGHIFFVSVCACARPCVWVRVCACLETMEEIHLSHVIGCLSLSVPVSLALTWIFTARIRLLPLGSWFASVGRCGFVFFSVSVVLSFFLSSVCVCVCLCVSSFFFPRIHADSFAFFSLPSRLFSFVCVCLSVGVRVHLELVVFVVFLSFLCFFSLPVGFVSLFLSSCLSVSVVSFVFFSYWPSLLARLSVLAPAPGSF